MSHISLITSLYRSEKHLDGFLGHQRQLEADLQGLGIDSDYILIVNDATPEERALLTPYEAHRGVHIVYTERESLYSSWNRGVALAQAPVMGFWNVDDRRTAPAIAEALEHFGAGCDLVDTPLDVHEHGRFVTTRPPMFNPEFISPKHLAGTFFMFTRDLYERTGAFDGRFRICGDMEWSTRPPVLACRYAHTQHSGGDFIIHGDNLSQGVNALEWVEINTVLLWRGAYERLRPVDPQLMREIWQAWGHEGADIAPVLADWLWGAGAQERYDAHRRWRTSAPLWQRLRLWLHFRLGFSNPEARFHPPKIAS